MENIEHQYLKVLKSLLLKGELRKDRTGVGTYSKFGVTLTHDFLYGFPLLTTKKVNYQAIIHELLWFIKGDTNIKYLHDNGVHIWDEWADENGDLGPIYGKQLRDFEGVDQLQNVIDQIKNDPWSRRHVITLWNPKDLPNMRLAPCHGTVIQFNARSHPTYSIYYLDICTYQRSADFFLGVPFNIASYSFLLCMICKLLDYKPGKLIYHFGDAHLYSNHTNQALEQLRRKPQGLPHVEIYHDIKSINDFKLENFKVFNYNPSPAIKAPVAV